MKNTTIANYNNLPFTTLKPTIEEYATRHDVQLDVNDISAFFGICIEMERDFQGTAKLTAKAFAVLSKLKKFGNISRVIFSKTGYSHIPDCDYVGVMFNDGEYLELYSDHFLETNHMLYIDGVSYFLGHNLSCDTNEEMDYLYATGRDTADGGERNNTFSEFKGELV